MTTVSTRILKDQLSHYLRRAEAGEPVVVLRDGKPVAALVPLSRVGGLDEESKLAELASQGLVIHPRQPWGPAFQRPPVASPGMPESERIAADRR
jgi:prevent-host-death family protein